MYETGKQGMRGFLPDTIQIFGKEEKVEKNPT